MFSIPFDTFCQFKTNELTPTCVTAVTLVSNDRLVHPTLYEPTSARWARTPLSPLRVCGPTQKNRCDRDLADIRQ